MSRDLARAFIFGLTPHGGNFPAPEKPEMTEAERVKIRELFTPKEAGEEP